MTKDEIKMLLMTLKTDENEMQFNNILSKIEGLSDKVVEEMATQEGDVETFLKNKLQEENTKKYYINDMFYYNISGDCVHIHLIQKDLHHLLKRGTDYMQKVFNIHILDAVDSLWELKETGFEKFSEVSKVYMISPIFNTPTFQKCNEMQFFNDFLFLTHTYTPKQLNDDDYVEQCFEASLARKLFGSKKNVSSAIIDFKTISSDEWQLKKKIYINNSAKEGIILYPRIKRKKVNTQSIGKGTFPSFHNNMPRAMKEIHSLEYRVNKQTKEEK